MEQEKEMLNEIELERAVYDEVIWALNQNKNIKIEKGLFEDVEFCERRIKEEELKKDGVWKKKEMEWEEKRQKEKELGKKKQNEQQEKEIRERREIELKLKTKMEEENEKIDENINTSVFTITNTVGAESNVRHRKITAEEEVERTESMADPVEKRGAGSDADKRRSGLPALLLSLLCLLGGWWCWSHR